MVTEALVVVEQRGAVRRLALNRPEQMNALSGDLVSALHQAVAAAGADPEVRVVHVTGTGRAFCAGADLIEAEVVTRDAASFRRWLHGWRRAFSSFEECPKPVVALLNGLTLAGGLELALACDYMVASSAARIGDVHANFGLVPGGGGTQRLTDAVGSRAARWLMFSGETLTADRALSLRLVQDVVEADGFEESCWEMGATMAARSQPGLAFMKRLSRPGITPQGLDLEMDGAAHLVVGPDAREGLAAFRDKRSPRFEAAVDG